MCIRDRGNNIYKNEGLVFLRELLQNAIDATKRQYYQDCRRKKYLNDGDTGFKNPIELLQKVTPNEYPIEIKLSVKKSLNGKLEDITEKDLKNPKKLLQDCECGVLVEITEDVYKRQAPYVPAEAVGYLFYSVLPVVLLMTQVPYQWSISLVFMAPV